MGESPEVTFLLAVLFVVSWSVVMLVLRDGWNDD
jgi:hypothetical protein